MTYYLEQRRIQPGGSLDVFTEESAIVSIHPCCRTGSNALHYIYFRCDNMKLMNNINLLFYSESDSSYHAAADFYDEVVSNHKTDPMDYSYDSRLFSKVVSPA